MFYVFKIAVPNQSVFLLGDFGAIFTGKILDFGPKNEVFIVLLLKAHFWKICPKNFRGLPEEQTVFQSIFSSPS